MLYSLAGAAALILVIGIGVTIYIHSLNSDDDSGAGHAAAVAQTASQARGQPGRRRIRRPGAAATQPAEAQASPDQPAETTEPEAPEAETGASSRARNAQRRAAAAAIIPGQLAIDSTPQGAQVQVDGRDRSELGHAVCLDESSARAAFHYRQQSRAIPTDSRTVNVTSGNRATTVIHLAKLMATLVVKSDPAGANIYVDGRDMGTKTPAQVSVDKGQHVVLVRMSGYIDETMNAQFALGQTFNFSPTLRPLGNTDNIKTVGKMSKLFGGRGQAGQAIRQHPHAAEGRPDRDQPAHAGKGLAGGRAARSRQLRGRHHDERICAGAQGHHRRQGRQGSGRRSDAAAVTGCWFFSTPANIVPHETAATIHSVVLANASAQRIPLRPSEVVFQFSSIRRDQNQELREGEISDEHKNGVRGSY